jgi:hypothetical protein
MAREARCFLLITADKSSTRRDGLLFRRYVAAIAKSPQQWYRMRDTDGLVRFTIAASLACSDLDNIWYTEKQFQMLGELSSTLYDSVAFFKHRSEGETVRHETTHCLINIPELNFRLRTPQLPHTSLPPMPRTPLGPRCSLGR